jgi:hypothetical protein
MNMAALYFISFFWKDLKMVWELSIPIQSVHVYSRTQPHLSLPHSSPPQYPPPVIKSLANLGHSEFIGGSGSSSSDVML